MFQWQGALIYALDVSELSGLQGRQRDVAGNLYQFFGRLAARLGHRDKTEITGGRGGGGAKAYTAGVDNTRVHLSSCGEPAVDERGRIRASCEAQRSGSRTRDRAADHRNGAGSRAAAK